MVGLALTGLAVALAVVVSSAVPAPRGLYGDLLRRGDERAARLERTAAAMAYREAVGLCPREPEAYLRLARLYLDWGRVEEALEAIGRAEQLEADGIEVERLWVAAHSVRADWPAVVEHGRRWSALAMTEGSNGAGDVDEMIAAHHALGRAYVALRDWGAAQAEYEAILQIAPSDIRARERLGVLLLGRDPDWVLHLSVSGTELARRLLAVFQDVEAADDPVYASALLGRVLIEEEEWGLATRYFELALSVNPNYFEAHAYLGYALDQLGYSDEAEDHLRRAVELTPGSAMAHTFLGLHYERLGEIAAARAEYEIAYDLDPGNPAICLEIGQAWATEREYVAAEIWLREAISLQPNDPRLWEAIVTFYLEHNLVGDERIVDALTKLNDLSPHDDAHVDDLQGWAAFQQGDYEMAEKHLQRAIYRDPTLASAHYHLGVLWAVQGAHQKAEEAFVRALDLDTTGELGPLVNQARQTD